MNKDLTDLKIGPQKHKELMQYYKKKKDKALDEHFEMLINKVEDKEEELMYAERPLLIKQEQYMIALDPYFFWDYQRGDSDPNARFLCIPEGKYFVQVFVFTVLWSTMAYSSAVFSVNTEETVEKGLAVIYDNETFLWGVVALVVHILLAMLYFFNEVISGFCDLGRRTRNLCHNIYLACCCKGSVGDAETDFPTLEYEVKELEQKIAEIRVQTDKEFPISEKDKEDGGDISEKDKEDGGDISEKDKEDGGDIKGIEIETETLVDKAAVT